ncbi:hypothetical protein B4U80_13454 [Leptotrombidium deliense]|uniref:BTB domain-containing protein n=1 Tax=Leptotrombidium deliense TaxID=299467 RepID=A0A443S623_9ACAR|nr:hypothetical protein B4U80_13454 [Leptotrombidium deliense]
MLCPVCAQDINALVPFETKVSHINRCLTIKGVVNRKTAAVKTFECPLCCKSNVNVNHIKKCAKNHGVLPKNLVSLVEKRVKSRHFVAFDSSAKRETEKAHLSDEINLQNKFAYVTNREITVNRGFVDEIKHSVVENHIESRSQLFIELPIVWKLSSLVENDETFTVTGFEQYCHSSKINNELTGFFVDNTNTESCDTENVIDNSSELLTKLRSLVNKPTHCDLIIKASDKKLVYAHSFIWKLHSLTGISVVKKHLSIIDCEDFKDDVIIEFLNYCYSGIINVNQDNFELLTKLAQKFDCKNLIDLLKQRSDVQQNELIVDCSTNSD